MTANAPMAGEIAPLCTLSSWTRFGFRCFQALAGRG